MSITIPAPALPTTDAEAIAFALDRLEPFQTAEFLTEWREGKDLQPWADAWVRDQKAAQGDWSDYDQQYA